MGELRKEHNGKLRPAFKPFGVPLRLLFVHQCGEFILRHLLKQLTKQTGGLYNEIALRAAWYEPSS